ncbi:hypothetical protein CTI14_49135, partial [Methylobacterium radiotolerans]
MQEYAAVEDTPDDVGLRRVHGAAFPDQPVGRPILGRPEIENVGGEINAATSTEGTSYTARVLGEDAGLALDVIGDILTDSVFDAASS